MRPAPVIAIALVLAGCGGTAPPRAPAARRRAPRAAARRRPAQTPALRRLLALEQPVFCGSARRRLVALTFDDGPGPYTHLALKELRRARARATFFLVGRVIRAFPSLPRREAA